jgi:hypothetical protein
MPLEGEGEGGEIAEPACRNACLAPAKDSTSACRHAPFPAFSGTRNDRLGKGFHFRNTLVF